MPALEALARDGYAHVAGPIDAGGYRRLASELGTIVGEERIALRPGAHAYVARPGPVPLHTDQPEVDFIAWHCERQDEADGASLLFDTRPFIDGLPARLRGVLHDVHLRTPPLAGGPPTMLWPVLRTLRSATAVFCSPWLRAESADPEHVDVLEAFRRDLSTAIRSSTIRIRMRAGDMIVVDNRRVLHGRDAIATNSTRVLHRLWLRQLGDVRVDPRPLVAAAEHTQGHRALLGLLDQPRPRGLGR